MKKLEGKIPSGQISSRWETKIKIDPVEIRRKSKAWFIWLGIKGTVRPL